MMTRQKIAEEAKICCLSKNQLIRQNMPCQQRLISPHKYLVMTQQNMLDQQKFDMSAK